MYEEILRRIKEAIINYDMDGIKKYVKEALDNGIPPKDIIEKAMTPAMKEVGEKFASGEIFLPEMLASAETFKIAMEVLKPELEKRKESIKTLGRVLIGTVQGDIHDLGKNLVATMLSIAGFEVIDLGVDVPPEKFVEKVKELKPDIVGLSALMTTTMPAQKDTIEALKRAGVRDQVIVMVGGAPVTESWAKKIGADGYASDAFEAVEKAKELLERRKRA